MTYHHSFDDSFDRSFHRPFLDHVDPDDRSYEGWQPDRLTVLTFLDGRLVQSRTEPVRFTEWEDLADQWDRRARRLDNPVPPTPPRPAWQRALDWLGDRVGGEQALLDLPTAPLEPTDPSDVTDMSALPAHVGEHLRVVLEHLDVLADRRPEPEVREALHAAAHLLVGGHADLLVTGAAAKVAAGIGWAVLKANGVLRPAGEVRVSWVQDALELPGSPSTTGKQVQDALLGLRHRSHEPVAPVGLPDLLPLGRHEVLTSATRRLLAEGRDRALEARAAA